MPLNEKGLSALDYILLDDPSSVEIGQKEVHEGAPSVVRRNEHVQTGGYFKSVPVQSLVDGSSAKKQPAHPRRSTRSTSSPAVVSQSSDPISVDSGAEDDANVITSVIDVKPSKKRFRKFLVRQLNESKRTVPERSIPAVDEVKKSKAVLKKKVKSGTSKSTSPEGRVSAGGVEEATSSVLVDEKKKKVEEKIEMVLKEKPEVVKGKGL
ncbi:hypothetical protein HanPI659440_Chr06g0245781 [Helianthus annuus]|nr:hypothetical protein HanPI659440_Chr06g0245781 [Helianthus annuus]